MIRVNLLRESRAKAKKKRASIKMPVTIQPGSGMMLGLLVGILLAVAIVQWYRLSALEEEAVVLDEQITELNREKAELAQVRAQYDLFAARKEQLTARIEMIEQIKGRQAGPVRLLDTLASAVSNTESLWLTEFNKTGETVSISGTALTVRSVADFMTRLINSGAFVDVNLQEAVQDAAVDYDSFNFTLEVVMESPSPAAQESAETAAAVPAQAQNPA